MEENRPKTMKTLAEYKEAYASLLTENEQQKQSLNTVINDYNKLYAEHQRIKNNLSLARAEFLLKILEYKTSFSKEIVQKAIEEFENFMFPKDLETTKKEAE